MDPVHLIYAADAKYGPIAGISVSTVVACHAPDRLRLHILSDGIAQKDLMRLRRVCASKGVWIRIYDIKPMLDERVSSLDTSKYISRASYARLLAADVLDDDVTRALYIDCDTVCLNNLEDFWKQTQTIDVLAAVPDVGQGMIAHKKILGFDDAEPYFNAGILGMNLGVWRKEKMSEGLVDLLKELPREKRRFFDQDALNILLRGRIDKLEEKWNFQFAEKTHAQADEGARTASILHFTGGIKPWEFNPIKGECTRLFLRAKTQSPWRWRLPESRLLKKWKRSIDKRLAKLR